MAKKESKEIEVKQDTSVSTEVQAPKLDEWGVQEFTSRDTVISKIFPMQMMSKKVAEEKARFGEFRDSVTNQLYGSFEKPVEFIPFKIEKVWIESELQKDNTWKYKRTVAITAANDDLRYEDEINGVKIKRLRTYNAYVLLPGDIESGIPKIISFRVSSMMAGKKLLTQMQVANRAAGLSPAAKAMKLTGRREKNDKGVFVVMDVEVSRDSSALEQKKALDWFKLMQAAPSAYKVDESDEVSDTVETVEVGSPAQF